MTPRQLHLARHALGLNGRRKVSYRNYFSVGEGCDDYADWMKMVEVGLAVRRIGPTKAGSIFGGDDIFHLSRQGASAALKPGESLDPEDFPPTEKR